MSLIESLLVIFTIIFTGIICERRNMLNKTQIEGFELYLFKIAIPCYLFYSTSHYDLVSLIQLRYISAYLFLFFCMSIVVFLFCRKDNISEICLKILSSSYVNSAIYTLPIITLLLVNPISAIIGNLTQVIIIQPIFIAILSFIAHKEKSILKRIIAIVSTPLVIAPIIGLLFNYFHFMPPKFIDLALQSLGKGVSSIALFVFGLSLGSIKISKKDITKELLLVVMMKNFIHPLFAFYIGKNIFSLEEYWLTSLVICGSAPPAFMVYIIAKKFSVRPDLVKNSLAISSVLSLVSLTIIMLILR